MLSIADGIGQQHQLDCFGISKFCYIYACYAVWAYYFMLQKNFFYIACCL